MTNSKTPRNPFASHAKKRKSGQHKPKNQRRQNGKNKQRELLKEVE